MNKRNTLCVLLLLSLLFVTVTACGTKTRTNDKNNQNDNNEIVTLGQYKNLEVDLAEVNITDQMVEQSIYMALASKAVETDRDTIQKYDIVNIDYSGTIDGKEFEGGSAEGEEIQVGSDTFIEAFETNLIGAKVGTTISFPLTFEEGYGTHGGEEAVFDVTINSLHAIPELTDEWMAANTGYESVAKMQEEYRANLQNRAEQERASQKSGYLIDMAIANATFLKDLSPEIEEYGQNMRSMYEYYANQMGYSFADYLLYTFGITEAMFNEELPRAAKLAVQRQYLLKEIAVAEGYSVSENEYAAAAEELMIEYGYNTVEELEQNYTKQVISDSILFEKAMAVIVDTAIEK